MPQTESNTPTGAVLAVGITDYGRRVLGTAARTSIVGPVIPTPASRTMCQIINVAGLPVLCWACSSRSSLISSFVRSLATLRPAFLAAWSTSLRNSLAGPVPDMLVPSSDKAAASSPPSFTGCYCIGQATGSPLPRRGGLPPCHSSASYSGRLGPTPGIARACAVLHARPGCPDFVDHRPARRPGKWSSWSRCDESVGVHSLTVWAEVIRRSTSGCDQCDNTAPGACAWGIFAHDSRRSRRQARHTQAGCFAHTFEKCRWWLGR